MAKTYIPILSYKNKALNTLSHAGSYIAWNGLIVFALVNIFGALLGAQAVGIVLPVSIIAVLGGLACIVAAWIINRIMTRGAGKK